MTQLVFGVIVGSGLLAMIYRFYLSFTAGREAAVEVKNTKQVDQDLSKITDDKAKVAKSTDDFMDLVNEFEKNSK